MHLRSNIYVKYFGTQLLGSPLPLGLTRGPLYIVYPVYPIVTPLGLHWWPQKKTLMCLLHLFTSVAPFFVTIVRRRRSRVLCGPFLSTFGSIQELVQTERIFFFVLFKLNRSVTSGRTIGSWELFVWNKSETIVLHFIASSTAKLFLNNCNYSSLDQPARAPMCGTNLFVFMMLSKSFP